MKRIIPEETIDTFKFRHNTYTYYLDRMSDGTYSISRDEHLIINLQNKTHARSEFCSLKARKGLAIGEVYWIQNGAGEACQGVLTKFVNGYRTALFGMLPRKVTSVYMSKEEAGNGEY